MPNHLHDVPSPKYIHAERKQCCLVWACSQMLSPTTHAHAHAHTHAHTRERERGRATKKWTTLISTASDRAIYQTHAVWKMDIFFLWAVSRCFRNGWRKTHFLFSFFLFWPQLLCAANCVWEYYCRWSCEWTGCMVKKHVSDFVTFSFFFTLNLSMNVLIHTDAFWVCFSCK